MLVLRESEHYSLYLEFYGGKLQLAIQENTRLDPVPLISLTQELPISDFVAEYSSEEIKDNPEIMLLNNKVEKMYAEAFKCAELNYNDSIELSFLNFVSSDGNNQSKALSTFGNLIYQLKYWKTVFKATASCPLALEIKTRLFSIVVINAGVVNEIQKVIKLPGFLGSIVSPLPKEMDDVPLQELISMTSFEQLMGITDKFKFTYISDLDDEVGEHIYVDNSHYRIYNNDKFFKKLLKPKVLRAIASFDEPSSFIRLTPEDRRYFTKLALAGELTNRYIVDITLDGVLIFNEVSDMDEYNPKSDDGEIVFKF